MRILDGLGRFFEVVSDPLGVHDLGERNGKVVPKQKCDRPKRWEDFPAVVIGFDSEREDWVKLDRFPDGTTHNDYNLDGTRKTIRKP